MTPHAELMLRVAATAERRAASQPRILELLASVDLRALRELLVGQRLLPLLGGRLEELAPERLTDEFRRATRESLAAARRQAALFEEVTMRLVTDLEAAGISAVPLKGPLLSGRVHGDPGARSVSADVDLLVAPSSLASAVAALSAAGYEPGGGATWNDGLPLFEQTLAPRRPWLPRLDLHWRVHWYERAFSERLLERSAPDERGVPVPARADELAMLLLMYSRDGYWGLRMPADIAAWWDRYGHELEPGALEALAADHPELRSALTASTLACERLVGLSPSRLLGAGPRRGRRSVRAARLANWSAEGSADEYSANVRLVDWLLVPRGGQRAYARRHVLLPRAVIAKMYGLPDGALARQSWRQLWHSAVFTRCTLGPWSRALWRTRFGREWQTAAMG